MMEDKFQLPDHPNDRIIDLTVNWFYCIIENDAPNKKKTILLEIFLFKVKRKQLIDPR